MFEPEKISNNISWLCFLVSMLFPQEAK